MMANGDKARPLGMCFEWDTSKSDGGDKQEVYILQIERENRRLINDESRKAFSVVVWF